MGQVLPWPLRNVGAFRVPIRLRNGFEIILEMSWEVRGELLWGLHGLGSRGDGGRKQEWQA